tara:strand:+ start:219 stop:674 length:456 start_codon:yes stop_codon:yes gene_type:complete
MRFNYTIIYYIFKLLKIKHYNKIISNLYLGNYCSIYLNKFDLIVNCTKDLEFGDIKSEKIRIPIDDNYIFKNNEILKYINILNKIDKYLKQNKKVLVFCKFGFQRSTTIVLLYLIIKKKIKKEDSIKLIKANRSIGYFIINNFNHITQDFL